MYFRLFDPFHLTWCVNSVSKRNGRKANESFVVLATLYNGMQMNGNVAGVTPDSAGETTKEYISLSKCSDALVVVEDEVVEVRRVHLAQRQVDMRPHHRGGRHIVRVRHVHERLKGHGEVPQRGFGDGGDAGGADGKSGLADAAGVGPGQR